MFKITGLLLPILLLNIFNGVTFAQSIEKSYKVIRPAQPTQTGNKIEVLEFFWYGCPHCYTFEPYLKKWLETKPDNVEFRRTPGIFSKQWMPHAKAYYTAVKMDVLEKIHEPLFDALHRKRQKVFNEKQLKNFFVMQGIDGDEFTRIYNSNEIDVKVRQAFTMGQRYGLTGVPAVVVNGKYLTSGTLAGTYEKLLKIIDNLVAIEADGSAKQ